MRVSLFNTVLILSAFIPAAHSQQSPAQLEAAGDIMGARTALARAAQTSPNNTTTLAAYAEFLERYGDPQTRDAYGKLVTALRNSGDTAKASAAARRLAVLDLLAG